MTTKTPSTPELGLLVPPVPSDYDFIVYVYSIGSTGLNHVSFLSVDFISFID